MRKYVALLTSTFYCLTHLNICVFQGERAGLEPFIVNDDDFNQYLDRMSRNGTYVDHVCVQNASTALGWNITVVHTEEPNIQIVNNGADVPTLVLGYIPELAHYVSLEQLHR